MSRRRIAPNWRTWVRYPRACSESLRYFERQGLIKTLSRDIAGDNVLGHLLKANHNLRLANRLFDMHDRSEFACVRKYADSMLCLNNRSWVGAVKFS